MPPKAGSKTAGATKVGNFYKGHTHNFKFLKILIIFLPTCSHPPFLARSNRKLLRDADIITISGTISTTSRLDYFFNC